MGKRRYGAWPGCLIGLAFVGVGVAESRGQEPAASAPESTVATPERKRISPADLEDTLLVIGELDERMRLAETKLGRTALDRKRQIGKLRGLIAAADQQIRLVSARVQRLDEKCRQMRLELVEARDDDGAAPTPDAAVAAMLSRAETPLKDARGQLERLCQQRAALQQKLAATQDAHLDELLNGAAPPPVGATGASALENVIGEELKGTPPAAAPKQ